MSFAQQVGKVPIRTEEGLQATQSSQPAAAEAYAHSPAHPCCCSVAARQRRSWLASSSRVSPLFTTGQALGCVLRLSAACRNSRPSLSSILGNSFELLLNLSPLRLLLVGRYAPRSFLPSLLPPSPSFLLPPHQSPVLFCAPAACSCCLSCLSSPSLGFWCCSCINQDDIDLVIFLFFLATRCCRWCCRRAKLPFLSNPNKSALRFCIALCAGRSSLPTDYCM